MKPYYEHAGITCHCGDVRVVLPRLASEIAQMCVTSPPYWGLRDYGVEDQLGLERTPEDYISAMVEVFREVKRILRDDGTLWLNMGDSYQGGDRGNYGKTRGGNGIQQSNQGSDTIGAPNRFPIPGLKPKDLCGIPWMLAFALRADGWYLRSDIIWSKPNPMPESVTDRPTKAHEYLFLLAKSERYYYNAEAIHEEASSTELKKFTDGGRDKQRGHGRRHAGFNGRYAERLRNHGVPTKRNARTVWTIATQPFAEAHFATFPEDLIQPCILAGCPAGGTVLDPFFGSGTTGLVAARNHCKCIGVELNPEYIEIASKRLSQQVFDFAGGQP